MEQAEAPASEPEKGTSDKQTGGQGYPDVGKWESGVTRGAGNQIGVTKWADVVGSKLNRGKANPLKENFFNLIEQVDPNYSPGWYDPKTGTLIQPSQFVKKPYGAVNANDLYPNIKDGKYPSHVDTQLIKDYNNPNSFSQFNPNKKSNDKFAVGNISKTNKIPSINKILNQKEINTDYLKKEFEKNPNYPKGGPGSGSDTIADWGKQIKKDYINSAVGGHKNVYKTEDGRGFIVNLLLGNLSSSLLDAREFFLDTKLGITTEIVVSVGLSPFGGTEAIEILNAAFLVNDISVMIHNMDADPENYMPPNDLEGWSRFIWYCENNDDFKRSCIDALFLIGGYALEKVEGKVIANRMRNLIGNGNLRKLASFMRRFIVKIYELAGKAPKALSNFIKSRVSVYEKFCKFIEEFGEQETKIGQSAKLISSVIPKTMMTVFLTLYLVEYSWKGLSLLFNFTKEEIASLRKQEVTPQMEEKVNIVLNGTNIKRDLITNKIDTLGTNTADVVEKSKNIVDSIIVNNHSEFENLVYSNLIRRKKISCERNEFKIMEDKKYDDGSGESNIYVIKNVEYYADKNLNFIKYNK